MAFDLVRLQLLQEALSLLKSDHTCTVCICRVLDMAVTRLVVGRWVKNSIIAETMDIISKSVILNPSASVYLFPFDNKGRASRIKYLERLIEDEMSGTYFMDTDRGIYFMEANLWPLT